MKGYRLLLFTLIITISGYGQISVPDSIIQIKITDENSQPLYGISIQKVSSNFIFSFTDDDGNGCIDLRLVAPDTSFIISGLGYAPQTITLKDLIKSPSIQLKETHYQLADAEIIRPTLEALLKKSQQQINIPIKTKVGFLSHYGNGLYTKIVENKNHVIHLRKEYGFFLTGGNCLIANNIWLRFYFFPTLTARSMDLLYNGKDTLKKNVQYIYGTNENIAYDATQRKIFEGMEIIYRYTPLFTSTKYFTFKWAEETSDCYCVQFSTSTGIPSHIATYKGQSKGTIYINKSNYRIQKINIDYFVRKFSISASSAFKRIEANFAYTENNICYIKECKQETIWKYPPSLKSKVTISELPSRPFAAKNQLIEKETWKCESYKEMKNKIKDRTTLSKISFLDDFVQAPYDSLKIHFQPSPKEYNLNTLNNYMQLEKQYESNSMKLYWSQFDENSKRYSTYTKLKDFLNELKEKYYSN